MTKSTYCEEARRNASSSDPIFSQIIVSLKRPIRSDDVKNIIHRRRELLRLFNGLDPNQAGALLAILKNRRDPIGRLFKCELATAFRGELLRILESITKKRRAPKPYDFNNDRKTDDRGTDNTGIDYSGISGKFSGITGGETNLGEGGEEGRDGGVTGVVDPPPDDNGGVSIGNIIDRANNILDFLLENDPGSRLYITFKGLLNQIESSMILISDYLPAAGTLLIIGGTLYISIGGRIRGKALDIITSIAARRLRGSLAGSRIIHRLEQEIVKLENALSQLTNLTMDAEKGLALASGIEDYLTTPSGTQIPEQGKDEKGRWMKKKPGEAAPGSLHEREVCKRVRDYYKYSAEQVHVVRLVERGSLPGQEPRPGLVGSYPVAKVDCVGSNSKKGGHIYFEAKNSGPPNFENPGLTQNQKRVYKDLANTKKFGGKIVSNRGPFKSGTKIPIGTEVRIITPDNMDDIYKK